jgi:beta-RFAP synthase
MQHASVRKGIERRQGNILPGQNQRISRMTTCIVRIQTGARLHFGPLSYRPQHGRQFGGIGMMVEKPSLVLSGRQLGNGRRDEASSDRCAAMIARIRESLPGTAQPVRLELEREIPSHSGLGSGTQLTLATCEAFCLLQGHKQDFPELVRLSGRGERSAIGLLGYQQGGFLVDAGHRAGESQGALATRIDFPTEWRILLIRPESKQGLHGAAERAAFGQLESMPEATTGRMCRLVLTELLPAIQSRDFLSFTESITEYGRHVGEFFAPLQGGVFSSPQMAAIADGLKNLRGTGVAQSSWGPTLAVFAECAMAAEDLRSRIMTWDAAANCDIQMTCGRNMGRALSMERSESF